MRVQEIEREAINQRETLVARLSRDRRLRQAEKRLKEAEVLDSFVNQDGMLLPAASKQVERSPGCHTILLTPNESGIALTTTTIAQSEGVNVNRTPKFNMSAPGFVPCTSQGSSDLGDESQKPIIDVLNTTIAYGITDQSTARHQYQPVTSLSPTDLQQKLNAPQASSTPEQSNRFSSASTVTPSASVTHPGSTIIPPSVSKETTEQCTTPLGTADLPNKSDASQASNHEESDQLLLVNTATPTAAVPHSRLSFVPPSAPRHPPSKGPGQYATPCSAADLQVKPNTLPSSNPEAYPFDTAIPTATMVPTSHSPAVVLPPVHIPDTVPTAPTPNWIDIILASYQGVPKPSLPKFVNGTLREFAHLKMGLDNLMNIYPHITEQYKYQVLLDHLGFTKSVKLASSFMYSSTPYSQAISSLTERYGQPRQLVQTELGAIMSTPFIRHTDFESFDDFSLDVSSLVGMLQSVEGTDGVELKCGSHVDRLLTKLSHSNRNSFMKYCLNRGILKSNTGQTYTLADFAKWLRTESQSQAFANRAVASYTETPKMTRQGNKDQQTSTKPKEKLLLLQCL